MDENDAEGSLPCYECEYKLCTSCNQTDLTSFLPTHTKVMTLYSQALE